MSGQKSGDLRRGLPQVARLAQALAAELPAAPDWALRQAARAAVAQARRALEAGQAAPDIAALARAHALALARPRPAPVVNATGVVLHTNLGRAPLAPGAAQAAAQAAAHYSDVELELHSGGRGQRLAAIEALLCALSGARGALAVNNNAAALLLCLAGLARGREVVVSRGELVEIGGEFRVGEIAVQAGVRLVEVGATNRTHLRDYAQAIGPHTGALLKVHRSNFEQRGFVAEVPLPDLSRLARQSRPRIPLVEDLGSGALVDLRAKGLPAESFAPARLAGGADVLCFSGDKLLGGPQAGLILAREAETARRLRRHPLARALRLGKLPLAALDWTLRALAEGRSAELPVLAQLLAPAAQVAERAQALAARLAGEAGVAGEAGFAVDVAETRAPAGGGSLPGFDLPSFAVRLRPAAGGSAASGGSTGGSAGRLAAALRRGRPPVIARLAEGALLLDARTLLSGDEERIAAALRAAAVSLGLTGRGGRN